MKVSIVITGSEFVYGIKEEKNSRYIAQKCLERGLDVNGIGIVGDNLYNLQYYIKMALDKSDIVILSGGLGATEDDLTREAISEAIGVPLIYHKDWLERLKKYYHKKGESIDERRKSMAKIPYGAVIVENPIGRAVGFIKVLEDVNKVIVALPGVPSEMKVMLEIVFEKLNLKEKRRKISIVRTFGLTELEVDSIFRNINIKGEYILNTSPKGVDIFLIDNLEENLKIKEKILKDRLEKYIYAFGNVEMEEVVGKLLREKGLTLATAESSTGGLISSRVINVPGSSAYMKGGIVAYSNEIKEKILGVKEEILKKFGAVSEETAKEMVLGVRKLFNTDIALSDTGIAGPTGATPTKPLGLHYIGFYNNGVVEVHKVIQKGERNDIRLYISQYGLNLIRLSLTES
ncbi:MAG: damage-inducible protein CinA [Persephonella sp.]|nr:MAG: damage-inducible protein CinA [Persephonella sp.]